MLHALKCLALLHHVLPLPLPLPAAQAAQEVTFWGVFYPWVFAYLGLYFLRVSQIIIYT